MPAPTATPEPSPPATEPSAAPAPVSGDTVLEQYLSLCTYLAGQETQEFETFGEFSAHLDKVLEAVPSGPPPAEIFEWHTAVDAYLQGVKELVDSQPPEDPVDPFILAPVLASFINLQQAEQFLEPEARERLAEIGCVAPAS